MTWPEQKKLIQTNKGTESKAPIHYKVSTKSSYQTTLRTPLLSQEESDFMSNPAKYINEFSPLYSKALQSQTKEKWTARTDYIKLLIKKALEHTIKPKEAQHFIMYLKEIKEDVKTQASKSGKELLEEFKTKAEKATTIEQLKQIDDEIYKASDSYTFVKVPIEDIRHIHNFIEDKIKSLRVDPVVYNELVKKLDEAKTSKEVGDVNNSATKAEVQGKITFDQLQKIYSLVREKDDYIYRKKDALIDIWKSTIKSSTSSEEIGQVIREINNSDLLSKDQKTQFETLAKKRLYELLQESQKKDSDMTIVDDFKKKIQESTQINELNELSFQITDNVASGNFAKAKVVSSDITNLHTLIDGKISQIIKEKAGTFEEFKTRMETQVNKSSSTNKSPLNLIMISNEVTRLRELNKKAQSSSLSQGNKDRIEIFINSRISMVSNLKPRPEVKPLDDIGKIDQSKIKSMTDALMISISEFTTKAQLDAFGEKLKTLTSLIGSTDDPVVQESMDKLVKLYNAKRRQIVGTDTERKPITSASEWEIKNLEYEARNPPKELLPPKEISDVTQYIWGVSEQEAIKKYVDKELKKYQYNVDFTDKQKADLDAIEKAKPWVLLTKAQIQKSYPEKAEEYTRDLWTYKTKKSDWQKNEDGARFWRSKVEKIQSGEWEKINANYLRDQYKKEVTTAISKGKPVPYDVVKQYSEFTKAQDSRERYDKGRHTSFSNESIAIDKSKKASHGYKIKLQNGKPMSEKRADEIIKAMSQTQSAIGDISDIMRRENVTIAHTQGTHPFLSTFAGVYHPTEKTITMGFQEVAAHESWHMVDEIGKSRHKELPAYDFNLMAIAKRTMNGGTENYISLSKSKSPEDLEKARNFRFHIGVYHNKIWEIQARLVEQYVAFKHRSMPAIEYNLTTPSFKKLTELPSYWSEESFMNLLPMLEVEIKRKIDMARN